MVSDVVRAVNAVGRVVFMVDGAARWAGVLAAGLCLLPMGIAQQPGGSERPVTLHGNAADGSVHPYCAVLDAAAFAESAPGLRGLHLLQDGVEIPFLTTISVPASEQTDAAQVMNLKEQDGALVFDLGMPARAYTALVFNLPMKNFAATVLIEAGDRPQARQWRRVGEFTLFDLSSDHLARRTAVALPEMTDRYLHITLRVQATALRAADLQGVDVPPSREAQSVYSTVAATNHVVNTVRESIAELDVPAHVPVQRIHFEWGAKATNFLRRVRVEAWPSGDPNDVETISGAISSTHRMQSDLVLEDAQHDVAMTLGANLQGPAHMRVIVERNGDGPLPLTTVALQMRQHKICFDAKSGAQIVLRASGDDAAAGASIPALANEAWDRAGEAVIGDGAVSTKLLPCGTALLIEERNKHRWHLLYASFSVLLGILCGLGFYAMRFWPRGK
jgi:hypothetical protein